MDKEKSDAKNSEEEMAENNLEESQANESSASEGVEKTAQDTNQEDAVANSAEVESDDSTVAKSENNENGTEDSDNEQSVVEDEQTDEKIDEQRIESTETEDQPSDELDGPNQQSKENEKTVEEAIQESNKQQQDVFKPDPEVDAAVDDIVRTESDEVIAETDAKLTALNELKNKKDWRQKVKGFFIRWWEHKPARYATFATIGIVFISLILLPTTRYGMLNALGARVSSSMRVVDAQTRLPLRNISVQLQEKEGQTDEKGEITFNDLRLGESKLQITKIGYAENEQQIVLGWGSNPIGDQELIATGEQFIFVLRDWKSGEPISQAEATASENSALADENGKITLTVGQENITEVEIAIRAEGYREESFGITDLDESETVVEMVPAKRHAFVSNRDGQFDIYTIYADGEDEDLLLAATGSEREIPIILHHPTRNLIAVISSRDGRQNSDGFLLDGLYFVNTDTGESDRIALSEQIRLVGWNEDRLVYWQVVAGTSRGNPERSKLISHQETTGERIELAAANYFNDVRLINGVVYYAVSAFAVPQSQAKMFSVSADGGNQRTLIDEQIYTIFRSSYNSLLFSGAQQNWFSLDLDDEVEEVGPQAQPSDKRFTDNPTGDLTAWVEVRDGRGVLLVTATDDLENETQVISLPGLESVQHWLNDTTLVFRVIRSGETADYVVYIDDPKEEKIIDVTASTRLHN